MAFKLEALEIVEVVRPIQSGATQPYLCQLADERLYAVKGRAALNKGLIAEVVSGWLAQNLEIPVPFFALGNLPRPLLDSYEDQRLSTSIGSGTLFASLWKEPVEAMVMPLLQQMPSDTLATIYAFDHWIKNGDRSLSERGGNPNLMVELDSNSLIAIDHNLAFSNSYRCSELTLHACRGAWGKKRSNNVFICQLCENMRRLTASLDEIFGQLPNEWVEDENDFLTSIRSTLYRVNQQAFWDELA
ncbi:HipA family kinase [Pacificimonas flava]|uniref:HipA family kinase n=1 Tax=Pacificimonas flava TaxID=1234595 RepID=UPI00122DF096|nr:HipA family kinase [Pacificimonas flava]MBB5281067.1 hypothetical protein [Pacificimonas flava]